jgi:hypothetical protein
MRPLFDGNSRIYIAQPPLYRAKKGKTERYLRDERVMEDFFLAQAADAVRVRSGGAEAPDLAPGWWTGDELAPIATALRDYRQRLVRLDRRYPRGVFDAFLTAAGEAWLHPEGGVRREGSIQFVEPARVAAIMRDRLARFEPDLRVDACEVVDGGIELKLDRDAVAQSVRFDAHTLEIEQDGKRWPLHAVGNRDDAWGSVTAEVRGRPFTLHITDTSPDAWLAVGSPFAEGRWDGLIVKLIARWDVFVIMGSVLAVALLTFVSLARPIVMLDRT